MNWREQVQDFKKELSIVPAKISVQAIRFGFFGCVGDGKSVTGGIFALGITPEGRIGWIDGEGERSGYAIDLVAEMAVKKYGGTKQSWKDRFEVIHIGPPFNPLRIVAAIEAFEDAGYKTVVADIMTQAWDSDGGYLDLKNERLDRMAGDDEAKRQRSASAAAANIKPWTHGKLFNKVNNTKCNIVQLFQAKKKFNVATHKPDEFNTPIQESGLTRTSIAVGRVEARNGVGGFCVWNGPGTKHTHPSLLALLPQGEQLRFEHAEKILAWIKGNTETAAPQPTAKPVARQPEAVATVRTLKAKLWDMTRERVHKCPADCPKTEWAPYLAALQQWLWDEMLMMPSENLSDMSADRLATVIDEVDRKLTDIMP
jgi:hypothetical protein